MTARISPSYHLAFVGGTEENVKGGVLFRREADTPLREPNQLRRLQDLPAGILLLQVTTEVEGIRLTRPISVEIHTESVLPRPAHRGRAQRKALELLARWGEQSTNRALAILATGGDNRRGRRSCCWPCSPTTSAAASTAAIFTLSTTPYILRAPSANAAAVFCPKDRERAGPTACWGSRYWIDGAG